MHRWQLYGNDTTSVSQIVDAGHLLCFAWKWHDDDWVHFGRGTRYKQYEDRVPDIHALRFNELPKERVQSCYH